MDTRIKGHYEQVFGSALINDSCDIYIVVGEDSYHLKYAPKLSRNRIDGKTESSGTCNGVECYIAVNKGTLEIIEVRFKDGELIGFMLNKFYISLCYEKIIICTICLDGISGMWKK